MPINSVPASSGMSNRSISASETQESVAMDPAQASAANRTRKRRSLPAEFQRKLPPLPQYITPVPFDQMTGLMMGSGRSVERSMAALSISPPHAGLWRPSLQDFRLVFPSWPEAEGKVTLDADAVVRLCQSSGWDNHRVLYFLRISFQQELVSVEMPLAGAVKLYGELVRTLNREGLLYVLFAAKEDGLTRKATMSALARREAQATGTATVGVAQPAKTPLWTPYMLARIDCEQGVKLIYLEEDTRNPQPSGLPSLRAFYGEPHGLMPTPLLQPAEDFVSTDLILDAGPARSVNRLYIDTDHGQMLVLRSNEAEHGRLRESADHPSGRTPPILAAAWKNFVCPRDEMLRPTEPLNLFRTRGGHLAKMTVILMLGYEKEIQSWRMRAPTDFSHGNYLGML